MNCFGDGNGFALTHCALCRHTSIVHVLSVVAENLAPSELKKLLNKQRKARRKAAELEKAKAVAVAEKREQHKSRPVDAETDAPPQDELVPDKLAKVILITFLLSFQSLDLESQKWNLLNQIYQESGRSDQKCYRLR